MNYTIVIDYQKDFIDGSLYNEGAIKIRDNVKKRINEAILNNNKLIFTKDTHYDNYLETNEGKNLPIKHCIKGTKGHDIDESIINDINYPYEVIEKNTFGYLDWKLENPENIYLLGVCTDICVISNALILKAKYPSSNVFVFSDACAGLDEKLHNEALDVMRSCQVKVL